VLKRNYAEIEIESARIIATVDENCVRDIHPARGIYPGFGIQFLGLAQQRRPFIYIHCWSE